MALPPLPENNTDRLFIYYTSGGGATAQEHVFTVRYNSAIAQPFDIMSDLGETMSDAGLAAVLLTGWQVLRAETQAQGSQFRFPVSVPTTLSSIIGTAVQTVTPSTQAREVRFIGRGLTSGRRVSMSWYGLADGAVESADFRFTPTPAGPLADVLLFVRGLGLTGAAWTNIGGGTTNWYEYVNWQYNSHWETEQRA